MSDLERQRFGDDVGGDKAGGDKVGGDKRTYNYQSPELTALNVLINRVAVVEQMLTDHNATTGAQWQGAFAAIRLLSDEQGLHTKAQTALGAKIDALRQLLIIVALIVAANATATLILIVALIR